MWVNLHTNSMDTGQMAVVFQITTASWFSRGLQLLLEVILYLLQRLGRVAQSVTCLYTYVCLPADPGVASPILLLRLIMK